jgi:tRNA uridine 5-carbamoylmethylation protein Kti12
MVAVSCGLPGVGKSTFINALLRSDVFDVFKVDLDLVYRQLKGQSSPSAGDTHENSAEFANADWRLTRSLAMLAVTDLLLMLRDEVIDFDTKVSTSQLESSALSLKACFDVVPTTFTGDRRVLIVVDDNMYYKSMRREYYNLARRRTLSRIVRARLCNFGCIDACAFAVLYFKSPGVGLATCLQRNAQRALSERVPDEVVQRIADRFEEPEATCADWEARSLITIVTDDAAAAAVRTNAECGHVRYSGSNLERTGAFFAALDELWSRPPMSVDALRDVDVSKVRCVCSLERLVMLWCCVRTAGGRS